MSVPPSDVSFQHTVVVASVAAAYCVFALITTAAYWARARKDVRLNKRSLLFTIVGGVSNAFGVTVFMVCAMRSFWPNC